MKTFSLVLGLTLFGLLGFFAYQESRSPDDTSLLGSNQTPSAGTDEGDEKVGDEGASQTDASRPDIEVVADGLQIPWDMAFLPDNSLLVTERIGTVRHLGSGRSFSVSGIEHTGEGGLLGIALHPDFEENNYVYLFETTEGETSLENRIARYTFKDDTLTFDRVILDNLRGARYHDGGRLEFGPDGYLYVTLGDAVVEREAQNPQSLIGVILRITDEGASVPGNPFGNEVYSYGHRNPQGLAWDDTGRLWSTEHGRSGLRSGLDEVNHIEMGGNYGWPDSEGDDVEVGTIGPALHSTAAVTWAPASAAYVDGSLYFGGLRGAALYEVVLDGEDVVELKEHFKNEFGRIRTVRLGPDGYLYITTSNRDGRGNPESNDDRIIRINPEVL